MSIEIIQAFINHQKSCTDLVRLQGELAQLQAEIENKRQWIEFKEQVQELRKKLHRFAWHSELGDFIGEGKN